MSLEKAFNKKNRKNLKHENTRLPFGYSCKVSCLKRSWNITPQNALIFPGYYKKKFNSMWNMSLVTC